MDNTLTDELNQENINEFDLDTFMAIAKIRRDGKIPYSEFMFKYINSIKKSENFTSNFPNDRILTLLDGEIIANKKRSGEDSLYRATKTLGLRISKSMDPIPNFQNTSIMSRNTGGTKTDDGNLADLTFQAFQDTPLFDSNGSKNDDTNLTVLTGPSSQDIPVNRDSNNDNNNGENVTDSKTEFEALTTFLMTTSKKVK